MFQKLENNRISKILKNIKKYLIKNNILDEDGIIIINDTMYFETFELKGGAYGKLKIYNDDNLNEYDLWKKDYICKGVQGKAIGKTNPIPSCLDYYLSDKNKKYNRNECDFIDYRNSYLGFLWM